MVIRVILSFEDASLTKKYLQLFDDELLNRASKKSPEVHYSMYEIDKLIDEL